MSIPSNIRTPDIYTDINLNAQRSGLPANIHHILFITDDVQPESTTMPISIYDKAQANTTFGGTAAAPTEASRMITAAVKTNRIVDVQILGKSLPVEI
jgi:phage tail sheath gpL-like